MKPLHVISSFDPVHGGPSEAVAQLGGAMQLLGYGFEVATLDAPGSAFLSTCAVPVYALGPGTAKYAFSRTFEQWLHAHTAGYDAVIVHGIWQFHDAAARRAALRAGVPYLVYPHGMLDPWFNRDNRLKHAKKLAYWAAVQRAVLRDAAAVLYTCERERALARSAFPFYRANDVVAGLGTAPPPADSGARLTEFAGKRVALFMGRIHPKKGCDLLIEAFARTLAADPEWHLVIAGPDQVGWKASLESLAAQLRVADRITWTGMLKGEAKWAALHSAEVFVLPSHQENFGVAVAEALGCGLPVLISNQVNIWREIESDGAGLVANDDLAGTSGLFARWSEMRAEQRAGFSEHARKCFAARFDISQSARNLAAVLERVATGSASGELVRA